MKTMTRDQLSIGDVVTGDYYGVPFEGRVRGYDGSGYVYIATKITVTGRERSSIALDAHQARSLRLVTKVPTSGLCELAAAVLGGQFAV